MGFRSGQHVGAYVIDGLLGRGGMASVWRAWDQRRGDQVAIKIIADSGAGEARFADRFIGEIRHHASLRHPNIVQVREVFSVAGQPCMVMDLASGGSLAGLLEKSPQRRLPVSTALPIITEVLGALDYAHRHGMVHRDVKPSNVLLDQSHQHAYLSDFGIALAVGEKRLTQMGSSVGTSAYMSPEQIRATGTIDYRSDVYSVGCVLYEALTGRAPFVADGADNENDDAALAAVLAMHLSAKPVPPKQRAPGIPAHVNALVMRALEKDPARRIPGCAEFARRLAAGADDTARPARAGPLGSPTRIAMAVVALAVVVAGVMIVMSG
ncbi:serine/threonine-protein kinase [Caballeronia humi]|uniref:non-specific serine/threonine protein kinase n=1 Tax=Caballeronia humi TaxID=326474 RepID=A0A158G758_9BURK|nr:serine/threonine-protein kinase [Caballeronia humi]SAL27886.1 serine/threonine protein kinase [Caballeronia humi]